MSCNFNFQAFMSVYIGIETVEWTMPGLLSVACSVKQFLFSLEILFQNVEFCRSFATRISFFQPCILLVDTFKLPNFCSVHEFDKWQCIAILWLSNNKLDYTMWILSWHVCYGRFGYLHLFSSNTRLIDIIFVLLVILMLSLVFSYLCFVA